MKGFKNALLYNVPQEQTRALRQKRFAQNNLTILLLSGFLTVEQLFYGLNVHSPLSMIGSVHLATALLMLIYASVSVLLHMKRPETVRFAHSAYELSFGMAGFAIAAFRTLVVPDGLFLLPTVYIAVLYGFGVLFVVEPHRSLPLYLVSALAIVMLFPRFQPVAAATTYAGDVFANNIIAWCASVLNYRRFVSSFVSQATIVQNAQTIREQNEELVEMSTVDPLTGLYNRRKINLILEREHRRMLRKECGYAVILLDIDSFKVINDTRGHQAGDQVLTEIGRLLESRIREDDQVGRWGGEEFLIVCPETTLGEAVTIAERLRMALSDGVYSHGKNITCSFGVAASQAQESIDNLIHRADQGLYHAKRNGKNRVSTLGDTA